MMTFDHYLQQATEQDSLTMDSSWSQGRTSFGGLSAAMSIARLSRLSGDHTLRSVAVNFCAPLKTAEPLTFTEQVLARGGSVSHIQGDVVQNAAVCAHITACFALARESDILVEHHDLSLPPAGDGKPLPFIKGLTPDFTQHVDFRFCDGGLPFTNSPHNHLKGWMRLKEASGPMTPAHVIGLTDVWPPTPLQKLKSFGPCATISWNMEMIHAPDDCQQPLQAGDWLWYEAEIRQSHGGYGHTEARICAADGTLLALSRQLVAIYDKR